MSQAARRLLRELQRQHGTGLARSRIPRSCEHLVRELQTCGAVQWQPSGAGQVLRVTNPQAFGAVAARHCPLGLDEPLDEVIDPATAVLAYGDAKRARSASCEGVFVRSARAKATIRSPDHSTEIPVAELTRRAGGAAILLEGGRRWSFAGTVAVVENVEAFWRHDRVLDVDLAVYTAGRMSSARLLKWLASQDMADCTFVHWGDYDPVGAAEFLRLREACPGRVSMHLPIRLEELLSRHGKRKLLLKQLAVLDYIRRFSDDPTIALLLSLWDRHQRALEQEILLVDPAPPPADA